MRQLTDGTSVGELFFYSVPASMYKLTIEGVFLDNLGYTLDTIAESSPFYAVIFLAFVVFAALMVMNMLIGVLCEVVSAVASTEKEEMNVLALRGRLAEAMDKLDQNRNGRLTEKEFVQIMSDLKTVALLNEIGVDPIALIDMAPKIFETTTTEDDDDIDGGAIKAPKEIGFEKFVEIVLDHRGTSTASLKDLREMKHDLVGAIDNLKATLTLPKHSNSSFPRSTTPSTTASKELTWAIPSLPCSLPDSTEADAQRAEALQEVESLLRLLQGALRRVQRPGLLGVASTGHAKFVLDWAGSMSETATSELERLQRSQTMRIADAS